MEINNNCFDVEPPKDANGNIIPLDTETLYDLTGEAISVKSFRYLAVDEKRWVVAGYGESIGDYRAGYTDEFTLSEPDSWDKLIKDLKNAGNSLNPSCGYSNPEGKKYPSLAENCYNKAFANILSRIETLRKKSNYQRQRTPQGDTEIIDLFQQTSYQYIFNKIGVVK